MKIGNHEVYLVQYINDIALYEIQGDVPIKPLEEHQEKKADMMLKQIEKHYSYLADQNIFVGFDIFHDETDFILEVNHYTYGKYYYIATNDYKYIKFDRYLNRELAKQV